jgi:potassium-transporting ATPase KdpC subunit
MKTIDQAFRLFVVLTFLTGMVYPLIITVIGSAIFPGRADGSLVEIDGRIVGSRLMGQKFTSDRYFWARPSAVDYNPLPSGGSNQGMISALLDSTVRERRQTLLEANPGSGEVPSDLLFASGSGLDPHISPEAVYFQIDRVVAARGLDNEQKALFTILVQNHIEKPMFGVLGQPRVNVLELNLAIDSAFANVKP